MTVWLARNKDGGLFMYNIKPIRKPGCFGLPWGDEPDGFVDVHCHFVLFRAVHPSHFLENVFRKRPKSHLETVSRNVAVQGHVLALERRDLVAVLLEDMKSLTMWIRASQPMRC